MNSTSVPLYDHVALRHSGRLPKLFSRLRGLERLGGRAGRELDGSNNDGGRTGGTARRLRNHRRHAGTHPIRLRGIRPIITKGKRQVPLSLQLWALLPEAELDVIAEFLGRTALESRSKTLFSFLVQNRVFWKDNPEDFAGFLRTELLPPDVDSLHLPRACFVTFWLLRVLCARDRDLLMLDCMREIRKNVWFTDEMLDKPCKIVPSPEVDALEICRRIVSHSSTYECIADYCRGWYFVLKVRLETLRRRQEFP